MSEQLSLSLASVDNAPPGHTEEDGSQRAWRG